MKIQHELNLVSVLILILLSLSIVLVGVAMITRTVYELNSRLLDLELANIMRKIDSIYSILIDTDLAGVDKYVSSAQTEVVADLDGYRFGESGHLFIFTPDRKVIVHRYIPDGGILDYGFADAMLARQKGFLDYVYNGRARFCVFDTFAPWGWTVALSITKEEMFAYRGIFVRIVTIVTASILLLSIVTFVFFSRRITGSIHKTLNCLKEVERGNLDVRIEPETRTEEIVILQQGINSMIARIRERTEELLKSREERMLIEKRLLLEQLQHKEAEISALQSQINPHFLYNTLECMNSIGTVHQVKEIQEISLSLSHLFKYAIKGGQIVTVAEEIHSVENYLLIQKIRFLDKFDIDVQVDAEILGMKMCKFLLQPIVENSIFHGLEPKVGKGRLRIHGGLSDRFIEFTVRDDGIGMDPASLDGVCSGMNDAQSAASAPPVERRSVGLFNIQNRIRLMYGDAYGLDIRSRVNQGTTVTMRLPMQQGEEGHVYGSPRG